MREWNADRYLAFKEQRTEPAKDLARKVQTLSAPQTVLDIGCGPGNSTKVLSETFKNAKIIGIDNSETMIEKAKKTHPDLEFHLKSVWDINGKYDLLFSNACLQWVEDHERLLPFLMDHVNEGGYLAIQVPNNAEEPLYRIISEETEGIKVDEKNAILSLSSYYDILSQLSSSFNIWQSVYTHALPSLDSMIDWVRETRLRPYLASLDENGQKEIIERIKAKAEKCYERRADGSYLFLFRRLFFIARG